MRGRALRVASLSILMGVGLMGAREVRGQEILWARQFGSPSSDIAYGISVDASGVYVAGVTRGTFQGQTSAGGDRDAFVCKYDADGNEVWTRQFGSPSSDNACGISVDASGVYVAGWTGGTFPGQTSAGDWDAFVCKYDADGNEVWTRQFGSPSSDNACGISVDASGVYVAGVTTGTLPGKTKAGSFDAFVRKYDLDGNEVWTRQFGTSEWDQANGISVDASGVYVAGFTLGTFPEQTPTTLDVNAFVRKYDDDGNEVWTRQFGSLTADEARGISLNASAVYVAGVTFGTLPGQISQGEPGDSFFRKYDLNGNEVCTRQFGTLVRDEARGISVDASAVYVAGVTWGTFPGQISAGNRDAFVCKYDANGNEVWAMQFGSSGADEALGISVDVSVAYVAGWVHSTLPGQTSAGEIDAFVVKLGPANQTPVANAGLDQILEATAYFGAQVTLDGSGSSDPDNDPLTYTWREGSNIIAGPTNDPTAQVTLVLGTHTIELSVDDGRGGTDTDEVLINVVDTTPPTVSVTISPNRLWPPNHKLVDIHATVTASDICDPQPLVILVSIVSDEPDNGLGDGDKPNDIQGAGFGTADYDFQLRAERSGKGDGRVYTVTYTATDASGNQASKEAKVTVPHDMGKFASWEEPTALPESFALLGNYPNPFNAETVIRYQLPKTSSVTLRIINLLSQEIRQLVDFEQSAGYYSVIWDGKDDIQIDVPTGIYLLCLETESLVCIQKITLIR